uniref:Uncharacterized protein n=1 Tax=Arundo donax TaxID=35708 RepID=A0A0A9FPW4_ARUDO
MQNKIKSLFSTLKLAAQIIMSTDFSFLVQKSNLYFRSMEQTYYYIEKEKSSKKKARRYSII